MTLSAPKQWKPDVHVKSYNPVTASLSKIAADEILGKNIERATDWLSATQNDRGAAESFSTLQELNL